MIEGEVKVGKHMYIEGQYSIKQEPERIHLALSTVSAKHIGKTMPGECALLIAISTHPAEVQKLK